MQVRVDGCQLRSGCGSRAHTSSENRTNAGRWPASSYNELRLVLLSLGAVGPRPAALKVGGGPGVAPPSSDDAAKPLPSLGGCRFSLITGNLRHSDALCTVKCSWPCFGEVGLHQHGGEGLW
jgi:hypothetical protein